MIFDGRKSVEYRKSLPAARVDKILIYESRGAGAVVGEAEVKEALADAPDEIWRLTHKAGGIDAEAFYEYFQGHSVAVAFVLDNIKRYDRPKMLADFGASRAPQNYLWVDRV